MRSTFHVLSLGPDPDRTNFYLLFETEGETVTGLDRLAHTCLHLKLSTFSSSSILLFLHFFFESLGLPHPFSESLGMCENPFDRFHSTHVPDISPQATNLRNLGSVEEDKGPNWTSDRVPSEGLESRIRVSTTPRYKSICSTVGIQRVIHCTIVSELGLYIGRTRTCPMKGWLREKIWWTSQKRDSWRCMNVDQHVAHKFLLLS